MKSSKIISICSYCALFWAAFFLPLKTGLSNFGIIVLLGLSVVALLMGKLESKNLRSFYFFAGSTLALFIPIALGTLYAHDLGRAFFQWGKGIFLLLTPIIVLRTDLEFEKTLKYGSWGLVLGGILALLILIPINIIEFLEEGSSFRKLLGYDHTGLSFVAPLEKMHPVYLGSYFLFALVLLWQSSIRFPIVCKILFSAIFLIGIVFLNSRIIFLIGTLLFLFSALKNMSLKWGIISVLGAFIFLLLIRPSLQKTYLYNKLTKGTLWELTENIGAQNLDVDQTSDSRMSRWLVSIDLFKEKPVLGHGTGSSRQLLEREYKARNMNASLQAGYDSHNQYLGFAVEYGVLGLLFLVQFVVVNLIASIKSDSFMHFCFIFIVAGVCLTENYLIRNMGINFTAFWGFIMAINFLRR